MWQMKNIFWSITLLMLLASNSFSQLSITHATVNSFNITPQGLVQVSVLNSTSVSHQLHLEAWLSNNSNQPILKVITRDFTVKPGLNLINPSEISFVQTQYGSNQQAEFVRTQHTLPSGYFKYCARLVAKGTIETTDEYCDEIESSVNTFLYLVHPYDKDTIETKYPLLLWNHSEPFNLLAPGESFRLILVELNTGQSPEAGVTANRPLFMKNNLLTHSINYPMDAGELKEGKRYAWQVQKMANGNIINKTEAWEFTIAQPKENKPTKYALLNKKSDAGFYLVADNTLYFRFEEDYTGGKIDIKILDENHKVISTNVNNESSKGRTNEVNLKVSGYNRYELNIENLKLKKGYYFLEVLNEKKQKYKLKFYVN